MALTRRRPLVEAVFRALGWRRGARFISPSGDPRPCGPGSLLLLHPDAGSIAPVSEHDQSRGPRDEGAEQHGVAFDSASTDRVDGGPAEETQAATHDEHPEERVMALVEADAPVEEIAKEIEDQEPADAADSLETLEPGESVEVLQQMDFESAAEALAHMDHALAETVLEDLPPAEAAKLLTLMDADDAADLLQLLPDAEAQRVLSAMPRQTAAKLAKLALYDPETAGGLMNTEFLALPADVTVSDAIEIVRSKPEEIEYPVIYVVDNFMRLVGAIELRDLLVNPAKARIADVMQREIDWAPATMDREEVATEFDRYDYITMPVCDDQGRLLGIVTIDDVVDIIRKEHTEDVYKQVGVGIGESVHDPLLHKLKGRFPWLFVNLLTSSLAATVVFLLDGILVFLPALAAIMGMIANQSGNAGQQSLAVTLRGLVLGQVHKGRSRVLLVREVLLGFFAGAAVGAILAGLLTLVGLFIDPHLYWRVGLIAGVAMTGAITLGCLAGAGMPLLLHRKGLDPATGSTIFLTMTTDTISFASFLGLVYLLRGWLGPL